MNSKQKDALVNHLTQRISWSVQEIEKWTEDCLGNKGAHYALRWSVSTVQAASRKQICEQVLRVVEENEKLTYKALYNHCLDEVIRKAKYPPQSTSATANLQEQFDTAAWAEILEFLVKIEDYK